MRSTFKDKARLLRRLAKAAAGRDVGHRPDIYLPTQYLGSEYGGWVVYPKELARTSIVYSFGVGEDISFDLALIKMFGVEVHAFDPTPKAVEWVATKDLPHSFHFHPLGIADFDGTATFNAPNQPEYASYTLAKGEGNAERAVTSEVRCLSTIASDLGHDRIDILKLDVEGAEYSVISDLLDTGFDIGQLLVEFHHAFDSIEVGRTNDSVERLRQNGFHLFYVSPRGEEYSFIHKSRLAPVS